MADEVRRPTATSNFVKAVTEVLITNGSSLTTMSGTLNLWKDSTLDIGDAWLHDGDPELEAAINNLNSTKALDDFFKTMSKWPLDSWSMDLITDLQAKIAGNWDENKSGVWNGMTSQQSSLIQATSGQNTAVGDAQGKSAQSALQNATAAGQPATDAGNAVLGVLTNGSSVQAQISA